MLPTPEWIGVTVGSHSFSPRRVSDLRRWRRGERESRVGPANGKEVRSYLAGLIRAGRLASRWSPRDPLPDEQRLHHRLGELGIINA